MIIFLDFDGVISSPRAYGAQRHIEDFWARWLDPIACMMVKNLCKEFGARIVVSSTWRYKGLDHVMESIAPHGLDQYVHGDWATGRCSPANRDSRYDRPDEVKDWLDRNGNPPFIILDDDSFYWNDDQKPWVVQPGSENGMMLHHYEEARDLLQLIKDES